MAQQLTFRVLEDIAKNLSGSKVTFPTFLDITFRVREALKDQNLSAEQLAKLVELEPLMSVKIIRMSNSAAMNPSGRQVADVKTAILRVGMEAVRTVSFAVAMQQLITSKPMAVFKDISQKLWEHSAYVAAVCRVLARRARLNSDEAMFAGLVHDLGVFYLLSRAATFPEFVSDRPALYRLLVDWHGNIGGVLLSALKQPEVLVKAVREHETDREVTVIETLSDVLYVANKIVNTIVTWREVSYMASNSKVGMVTVHDLVLGDVLDNSQLDSLFDNKAFLEVLRESEAEVVSLKKALT